MENRGMFGGTRILNRSCYLNPTGNFIFRGPNLIANLTFRKLILGNNGHPNTYILHSSLYYIFLLCFLKPCCFYVQMLLDTHYSVIRNLKKKKKKTNKQTNEK